MTATVHQILWAYQDRGGSPGIQPVAASFGSSDEVHDWQSRLRPYVRMTDAENVRRPRASLCYLTFRGSAVLMRRARGAAENRSDQCHALIAPVTLLTPIVAAGAMEWRLWSSAREPLTPFDGQALVRENDQSVRTMLTRARSAQQPIAALLAATLREPGRPVSAVAADAWEGRCRPDSLLWGLVDLGTALMRGTVDDTAERWTFSTYETNHASDHLPWTVFGPPLGQSAFPVLRTVVEPLVSNEDDAARRVAEAMVHEYARGGPAAVDELLRAADVRQAQRAADRVAVLAAHLGLAPAPVPAAAAPVDRAARAAEPRAAQPPPRSPEPRPPEPRSPEPRSPEPRSEPRSPGQRPVARRATALDGKDDDFLVRTIIGAESGGMALRVIDEMRRRRQMSGSAARRAARATLARNDFCYEHLHRLLDPPDLPWALHILVRFVCADEDLARPDVSWDELADTRTPYLVVEAIVRHAADRKLAAAVAPWLGMRWLAERGIDAASATAAVTAEPALSGGRDLHARIRTWPWTPVALVGSTLFSLLMLLITITVVTM